MRKYLFAGGYHTTILAPIGDRMLDGKRYYAAFPDENPERPIPHALLLQPPTAKVNPLLFRSRKPQQARALGSWLVAKYRIIIRLPRIYGGC